MAEKMVTSVDVCSAMDDPMMFTWSLVGKEKTWYCTCLAV